VAADGIESSQITTTYTSINNYSKSSSPYLLTANELVTKRREAESAEEADV
jgi:hypothetical protein